MNHTWDFSPVWEFRGAILRGACFTLILSVSASAMGIAFGILLASGLASKNTAIRLLTTGAVEAVRACPPLVLLFWIYFLLPLTIGFGFTALQTALICLTVIFACFAADVFRGALKDIPRETLDSGRAIGMDQRTLRRRVILPEISRRSLPAINALFVNHLKMSSLASIIAVSELTYVMQMANVARPHPFEIYTVTAAIYVTMILPLVWILRWLERKPAFALNPSGHAAR